MFFTGESLRLRNNHKWTKQVPTHSWRELALLRHQGTGASLRYGFNEPEDGFVWSTFNFGLDLRRDENRAVMVANFPHSEGVLRAHNGATGGRAYRLREGANRIVIFYSEDDPCVHFTVTPRRALPQDVRELGLMLCSIQTLAEQSEHQSELNEGEADSWIFSARPPTEITLTKHLLESFIGPGFTLAYLRNDDTSPLLIVAVYLPPNERSGQAMTVMFSINEEVLAVPVEQCSKPADGVLLHLPEIAYRGEIDLSAFRGDDGEIRPLDIFLCDKAGKERFPLQSFHWRGRGFGGEPSPDHIFRVAGKAGQEWMLFGGATWYVKLCRIYESIVGRSIESCGPILDWGVGCARIARFFPDEVRSRVHGVDIDAVNIEWCRANISNASFEVTSTSPPLPFPDNTFDIVYGHSVLTHISEKDQHAWLKELARVTRRGSLCLITILAEPSWVIRFYPNYRTPSALAEFMEAGFLDDGSVGFGVDASQPGTYRNVSHSSAYVRAVWSEYFEIISIVPIFADLQSLVILRRRE